jgi:diguanylate cyclase (GGDEF)-like protein
VNKPDGAKTVFDAVKFSIKYKLITSFVVIIALTIFAISIVNIILFRKYHVEQVREESRILTETLSKGTIQDVIDKSFSSLDEYVQSLIAKPDLIYVIYIDEDGRPITQDGKEITIKDSNTGEEKKQKVRPVDVISPEINARAFNDVNADNHYIFQVYYNSSYKARINETSYALLISKRKYGAVRVGFSLENIDKQIEGHIIRSLLIAILSIAMGAITGLILTKIITRPLELLVQGTKAISSGQLDYRVKVDTKDELGILASAFNQMSASLLMYMENLKKANLLLNRRVNELTILYDISQAVNQTDDHDELLIIILDAILKGVNSEKGSIMLVDEQTETLVLRALKGEDIIEKSKRTPIFKVGEGIAGMVAKTGTPVIANKGYNDERFILRKGLDQDLSIKNILCAPMITNDKVIGVVNITNKKKNKDYDNDDLSLLTTIATQLAVIVEKSRLHKLAITEGLTQLYIHRYFQIRLDEEILRSERYGYQFALIMFDIDHFKKFNDTYGHQQGDIVLIEVAKMVRECVRNNIDIPARYGGEEFAIILPEQSSQNARIFAERLRKTIAARDIPGQSQVLHVQISLGIGNYPMDASDKFDLIKKTDQAMYYSKENGRNQVWTYQEMLKHKKSKETVVDDYDNSHVDKNGQA